MKYAALMILFLSGCVTRRECYRYSDMARASGRIEGLSECDRNVVSELEENMKLLECRHDYIKCESEKNR